jgi:hypothetical protein
MECIDCLTFAGLLEHEHGLDCWCTGLQTIGELRPSDAAQEWTGRTANYALPAAVPLVRIRGAVAGRLPVPSETGFGQGGC